MSCLLESIYIIRRFLSNIKKRYIEVPVSKMDNSNNIFVNLPHIILSNIITHLGFIDRICFTLVCRKWYLERDKYLRFSFSIYSYKEKKKARFKSYQYQFNQYANTKLKDEVTIYCENKLYKDSEADTIDVEHTGSLVLRYLQYIPESLEKKLLESNVMILSFEITIESSLNLGRLDKIITLCLSHYSAQIKPGDLPPKLEDLNIFDSFNHPILPNALPSSLQSLGLSGRFNQKLENLPSNISCITLGEFFDQPLSNWSLPSSLEDLNLYQSNGKQYDVPLTPNLLPASIKFLYCAPPKWIPTLAECFPRLEKLEITPGGSERVYIEARYIPSTVTRLMVNHLVFFIENPGIQDRLPSSIIHLNIFNFRANLISDEPHYQTLEVNFNKTLQLSAGMLPPKINTLRMNSFDHTLEVGTVPDGVEKIYIRGKLTIQPNAIPSSVKLLSLNSYTQPFQVGTINHVEKLYTYNYKLDLPANVIPSVRELTLHSSFFKDSKHSINDIPPHVVKLHIHVYYRTLKLTRLDENTFICSYDGFVLKSDFDQHYLPKHLTRYA